MIVLAVAAHLIVIAPCARLIWRALRTGVVEWAGWTAPSAGRTTSGSGSVSPSQLIAQVRPAG